MSTFKKIRGTTVQNNAGGYPAAVSGQLWYDSTNKVFKHQYPNVTSAGSFRTANSANTARSSGVGGGPQTSSIFFGGFSNPPAVRYANAETYNGTSFSETGDLNQSRNALGGVATSSASALAIGGYDGSAHTGKTETWNGSSWTEVGDLNNSRANLVGAGTATAALGTGGYDSDYTGKTETWNGSSWTEVADLNDARAYHGGSGTTNTEALVYGGDTPGNTGNTESWNGSSWTEVNNLNTARNGGGYGSTGTYTACIYIGGSVSPKGHAELWDGTSWSEQNDLNSAREELMSSGSSTAAIAAFGRNPSTSYKTLAEEWTGAGAAVGAWATGGNLNQSRYLMAASGTVDATIAFGGRISPPNAISALNESYNGTSWTEVADLNTGRMGMGSTTGPSTAVLAFGGTPPNTGKNEQWDGSSWTEIADLNTAKSNVAGCGTTTAALATGGTSNTNELWNGSAWTEVADLNNARNGIGSNSSGTSTATLVAGGEQGGPPYALYSYTEVWNGSAWTEVNDLNTARHQLGHSGTSTSALAFGGAAAPGDAALTEDWNGVSWSETADMNTARGYPAASGTAAAALAVGGDIPPGASSTATEEWSIPSNVTRTITTS